MGDDVGVKPALVGVLVGTLAINVLVGVGVGLPFVLLLPPPQAATSVRIASPTRLNQASLARRDGTGKMRLGIIVSPFSWAFLSDNMLKLNQAPSEEIYGKGLRYSRSLPGTFWV